MINAKAKTIDEYLASLSDDKRLALERLRRIIQAAVPRAEECISYQMPAFCLDGKAFIWFSASAHHCSIYGVSGAYKDEFKNYDTSGRGTLRFQAADPLPSALIRKLVKARAAKAISGQQAKKNHGGKRPRSRR